MKIERLVPACKSCIWGGDRLIKEFGKNGAEPCGEAWKLSMHDDGLSLLEDGYALKESVKARDLGENCQGFEKFPLLIKLIDARLDLSVQVHPNDAYAKKKRGLVRQNGNVVRCRRRRRLISLCRL